MAVNDRNATEIRTSLIQIIDHAMEQIVIEHAYFSGDKVIAAIQRAAMRGIQSDTAKHAYQQRIDRLSPRNQR